jgi:cell division protein FtsW
MAYKILSMLLSAKSVALWHLGCSCGLCGRYWAGLRIARYAPDLSGRLIAAGSVSMLANPTFINICGVLGIVPLSGKPVPFISYADRLSLQVLCWSVLSFGFAQFSTRRTEFDRRRQDMSLQVVPICVSSKGERCVS